MKKINEGMGYQRNPEVQEAEEDLNRLYDPVSLSMPASEGSEIVNLLSSDDSQPPPVSHPDMFPVRGLGGIPTASMDPKNAGVRALSPEAESQH